VDQPCIGNVEDVGQKIQPISKPNPGKLFELLPHLGTSQRSRWPDRTGTQLIDRHEAFALIDAVNHFLDKLPVAVAKSLCPCVDESDLFPCWSRCTVRHPWLPFKPTELVKSSVLRAVPASYKDGKQTRAGVFDTVMLLSYPREIGLCRAFVYFFSSLQSMLTSPQNTVLLAFTSYSLHLPPLRHLGSIGLHQLFAMVSGWSLLCHLVPFVCAVSLLLSSVHSVLSNV
jgi:hypothetical protein